MPFIENRLGGFITVRRERRSERAQAVIIARDEEQALYALYKLNRGTENAYGSFNRWIKVHNTRKELERASLRIDVRINMQKPLQVVLGLLTLDYKI